MKFVAAEEKNFLDSLVQDYTDESPYSKVKKDIIHSLIDSETNKAANKIVLQLGCSNGYETRYLSKKFKRVDVIDGSAKFIAKMRKSLKLDNVNYILSLFEEYDFKPETYDYIFCNYILEHVFDPVLLLKTIKKALRSDGKLFATVPNANAFSRQLAKQIGLVKDLRALTPNDRAHGHRRVYDLNSVAADFQAGGLKIAKREGLIFKILADFQLNKMLQEGIIAEEHVWGLQKMGTTNNEFCDSIFVVANRGK